MSEKKAPRVPKRKFSLPSENTLDDSYVPLDIRFDGTLVRSLARILDAVSKLFDEFVNWAVRKLRKNAKNQLGENLPKS